MQMCMATKNTAGGLAYGCSHTHVHGSWNQGKKGVPGKTCVTGQMHVYLTDSECTTNEGASIRENELSAGTLRNPRTQVTSQHSFRIRTCGAKGPYYQCPPPDPVPGPPSIPAPCLPISVPQPHTHPPVVIMYMYN